MTSEREAMAGYALKCGQRIRMYRQARDLDQLTLAARLGVTQGTVSRWETGGRLPRDYWRARLSVVLEVPSDILFPAVVVSSVA